MRMTFSILFVLAALLIAGCQNGKTQTPAAASLEAGKAAPDVTLRTADGEPFDLGEAYAKQPTVILFYRGGWCPYCNTHLQEVAEIQPQLEQMGYQVLAVSPDRPAELRKTAGEQELDYRLLSDADMEAAKGFGVAFEVDPQTITRYKGYGIDLEQASGRDHHMLPVPSVYLVDTSGRIVFAHSNPDYKVRLSKQAMLAAARQAASSAAR